MTKQEKNTWVYLALGLVIPVVYAIAVFGQGVDYVQAIAIAIGSAIAGGIVAGIVLGITSRDKGRTDEGEVLISRRGELVGYYVLSIGVIGALALVLTERPHFWIAQAIYAAFVISAIASSNVKLVAYRRGF